MRTTLLNRIRYKIGREIAQFVFKKPGIFPPGKKVVSFTFDDFPSTAITNGARILESFNAKGTFYTSFGLAGGDSPVGPIATQQEIIDLANRGHEIAGHTFGHTNCARRTAKAIINDCRLNQEAAARIGEQSMQSFAYPFGGIDPTSKKVIGNLYGNARVITPFINRDKIDLAALGSIELYRNTSKESVISRFDELEGLGGWLVFHLHDVSEEPSKFGCSIDFFEDIVRICSGRGFQIMPMREAAKMASL